MLSSFSCYFLVLLNTFWSDINHGHFQISVVSSTNMNQNNMSLCLFMDQTEVINQPFDHIWLTFTICVLIIMVNIWAMKVLNTKEDTCITKLVKWDCVSNILISVEVFLITLDGWFPLNMSAICAGRNVTFMFLNTFQRLVPVAIVTFRYIMVCHPIFFINCGKEKVWKWILGSVIVPWLAIWIYNMNTSSIAFRFLRCMGREEDFG